MFEDKLAVDLSPPPPGQGRSKESSGRLRPQL